MSHAARLAFAFVACCGLVGALGVLLHDLLRKVSHRD